MLDFDLFEKSKGVWRVRSASRGDKMAPETDAIWPKVLRRVASYSADVFHNQTVCTEHLRRSPEMLKLISERYACALQGPRLAYRRCLVRFRSKCPIGPDAQIGL